MDACISQHKYAPFYSVGTVYIAASQYTEDIGETEELNPATNTEIAK